MNLDQQNLIKMLGIESLPDERKIAILDKLTDLIQKRLMVRMLAALPEDQQKEFAEVLEAKNPERLQSFITTNFPDFQEWIVEETTKVKQELDGFIKQQIK